MTFAIHVTAEPTGPVALLAVTPGERENKKNRGKGTRKIYIGHKTERREMEEKGNNKEGLGKKRMTEKGRKICRNEEKCE